MMLARFSHESGIPNWEGLIASKIPQCTKQIPPSKCPGYTQLGGGGGVWPVWEVAGTESYVHCDVIDAVTKESSQIFTHSTFLEYTIQLFQNNYHHITVIILQGNYTLIL